MKGRINKIAGKSFKNILLIFFLGVNIIEIFNPNIIFSFQKVAESKKISFRKNKNFEFRENYILGPGDLLKITIYDAPELNYETPILSDGYIPIPFRGQININGLTLEKAEKKLISELSKELLRPDSQINIIQTRPMTISILGEINKPGIYDITNRVESINNATLVNAIKLAGGVTKKADLKNIQINRVLPLDASNQYIKKYKLLNFQLADLYQNGDQSQNPLLFDGDMITINKSEIKNEAIDRVSMANLAPDQIKVSFIGEVFNPGPKLISPNTSLIQGLFLSGGPIHMRSNKSKVKLIRVNKDGTISLNKFNINLNKKYSLEGNPLLQDGDTVLVGRASIAQINDFLRTITVPFRAYDSIRKILE